MIRVTSLNRIIPKYASVIRRFKSLSVNHNFSEDIFYQTDYLDYFYSCQQECLDYVTPTLDLKIVRREILPERIARHESYQGYEYFLVFSATLGEKVDGLIAQYSDPPHHSGHASVFRSFFLDSWCSESVEEINKQSDACLNEFLNQYEGDHLDSNPMAQRSRRFSPGYGDLSIMLNHDLTAQLGLKNIKVIPENGLLLPRKSTICLIGLKKPELMTERWTFYAHLQNFFSS